MKTFMRDRSIEEQASEKKKTFITENQDLFESKWKKQYPNLGKMFENPAKSMKAAQTIQMLENQQRHLQQLDEVTITTKFGDIAPRVLDILRLVYPNQIAHELVDVQTMKSMVDVVYFVKPVYAQAKSDITKNAVVSAAEGSTAFRSSTQASEEVVDLLGTGDGSTLAFTGTPSYVPLRPGTVKILADGALVGQDDGNGLITGATIASGTVDYAGGSNSIVVTFLSASAPAASVEIALSFLFNSETNTDDIGAVDIVFSTFQVKARKHPLKLRWSVDAALVTQGSLNFDVEDVISLAGAQELKAQKDYAITGDLRRVAGPINPALVFDATEPTEYAEWQHAQGFRRRLAKSSNQILEKAGRGMTSWYVVGTDVNEYMTYLDAYIDDPNKVAIGVYKVGTYRGQPVFLDSKQKTTEWMVGYKGRLFGDSGYILAEYIELYATPTIELDDFISRKGIASFYDKKVITSEYFQRGEIINLS